MDHREMYDFLRRTAPDMRATVCAVLLLLAGVTGAGAQTDTAASETKGSGARLEAPKSWETPDLKLSGASRWRLLDAYGVEVPRHSILDPYNQNILKGDIGLFGGKVFPVLTAVGTSNTLVSSRDDVETDVKNKAILALEIFHGATVFKPKDWSFKASGQEVANRGNKDVDDFALLEAFGEIKLFDVGATYDFTSVRAGFQPFNSDFYGFLFKDINLAALAFGELSQNRYRWGAAFFDQRVKSEGGGLTGERLDQQILVANWVYEDLFTPGFIGLVSFHNNRDHSKAGNAVDVSYLGFASAGHWGRVELNPAFYYAFGTEERNPIAGRETSVGAYFAGTQFAYPSGYLKYRAASFVASGDSDPTDDRATGFDSINDNVNLFGGANSFVIGNAAFFTRANSFLPSNRTQGIANFVNPGILLLNAGIDAVMTPKLFLQINYNNFRFMDTASLPLVGGAEISRALAQEVNATINYRLFLNENLILQLGGNVLLPQEGGKQLLGSDDAVSTGNFGIVLVY
jgi:hypothetical protein